MKVTKIFLAAIITAAAFCACKLDFKNEGEDKWVVSNENQKAVEVTFNETVTAIPVGNSVHNFPFNASVSIDDAEHVNFTTSYSYAESTARRSLTITAQNKYKYEITNNTGMDITFDYYYKMLETVSKVTEGAPDENDIATYTIEDENTGSIYIYNNQPTLTFKNGSDTLSYTSTTDTSGTICITVK